MLRVVLVRLRGPVLGCVVVMFGDSGAAAAVFRTDEKASPPLTSPAQPPFGSARAPLVNTPPVIPPLPVVAPATADKAGDKPRVLLGWSGEPIVFDRAAPRNLIEFESDDIVEVGRAKQRQLDETNPFE